jgi:hypothetical protein
MFRLPLLFATCRDGRVRTTRGRCRINRVVEFVKVVKFVKVAKVVKVVKVVNLVSALAGTPEHRRAERRWSGGRHLRGAGGSENFGKKRRLVNFTGAPRHLLRVALA